MMPPPTIANESRRQSHASKGSRSALSQAASSAHSRHRSHRSLSVPSSLFSGTSGLPPYWSRRVGRIVASTTSVLDHDRSRESQDRLTTLYSVLMARIGRRATLPLLQLHACWRSTSTHYRIRICTEYDPACIALQIQLWFQQRQETIMITPES